MDLKKYSTFLYWAIATFLLICPPVKCDYCIRKGHEFLWSTNNQVDITKLILYEIALFIAFAFIWKISIGDDLSDTELDKEVFDVIAPSLKHCSEVTAYYRLQGVKRSESEAIAIGALGNASLAVKKHFRAVVQHVYKMPKSDLEILANEFLRKQRGNV